MLSRWIQNWLKTPYKLTYFKQHKRGITFFQIKYIYIEKQWKCKKTPTFITKHYIIWYCYTVRLLIYFVFHILLHFVPISCQSYLNFLFDCRCIVLVFRICIRKIDEIWCFTLTPEFNRKTFSLFLHLWINHKGEC